MPMLHGCAYPHCETFTLGVYCVEHEVSLRAEVETERVQRGEQDSTIGADAPRQQDEESRVREQA